MNDDHESLSDEAIDKLLAPLREGDCPEEVRRANRRAIEVACARRVSAPWWRRTVAVPIPLAVAASLAFFISAAAALWLAPSEATDSAAPLPQHHSIAESSAELPGWSIKQSYILSIETLARMQSLRPNVTEDRNDS